MDSQQKIGETCRPREAREVYRKGPRRRRSAARLDNRAGLRNCVSWRGQVSATHYLPNPSDVDEVVVAFDRDHGDTSAQVSTRPLSVEPME